MKTTLIFGILAALATGVAIGTQSTISSRIGAVIGPVRTGMLVNFTGGIMAGLLLLGFTVFQGRSVWQMPTPVLVLLLVGSALGILIITGVSFSLQLTGVAAGLATIILGQMVASVIIDAKGWGATAPIPVTLPRVLGLLVIAAGVFLLLPRK
jgi:bacterial/archaeal transporter family-2 protein